MTQKCSYETSIWNAFDTLSFDRRLPAYITMIVVVCVVDVCLTVYVSVCLFFSPNVCRLIILYQTTIKVVDGFIFLYQHNHYIVYQCASCSFLHLIDVHLVGSGALLATNSVSTKIFFNDEHGF